MMSSSGSSSSPNDAYEALVQISERLQRMQSLADEFQFHINSTTQLVTNNLSMLNNTGSNSFRSQSGCTSFEVLGELLEGTKSPSIRETDYMSSFDDTRPESKSCNEGDEKRRLDMVTKILNNNRWQNLTSTPLFTNTDPDVRTLSEKTIKHFGDVHPDLVAGKSIKDDTRSIGTPAIEKESEESSAYNTKMGAFAVSPLEKQLKPDTRDVKTTQRKRRRKLSLSLLKQESRAKRLKRRETKRHLAIKPHFRFRALRMYKEVAWINNGTHASISTKRITELNIDLKDPVRSMKKRMKVRHFVFHPGRADTTVFSHTNINEDNWKETLFGFR